MNPRINYNQHSPDLVRRLFELSQVSAQGSLGQTLADLVYERVRLHFSAKEMSELTFAIGIINLWNRLNVSSQTTPGSLTPCWGWRPPA